MSGTTDMTCVVCKRTVSIATARNEGWRRVTGEHFSSVGTFICMDGSCRHKLRIEQSIARQLKAAA